MVKLIERRGSGFDDGVVSYRLGDHSAEDAIPARELLTSRSDGAVATALAETIDSVPASASPRDVIATALDMVGSETFTPETREFSARRRAVIAANLELRERDALKGLSLTAAMTEGLTRRGVPPLTAKIAAEFGALALDRAYEQRSAPECDEDLDHVARRALGEIYVASAEC